jgi:hypothetical protein
MSVNIKPNRGEAIIISTSLDVIQHDAFASFNDERIGVIVIFHLRKRVP